MTFHINTSTGDMGVCRAKQGRCPFGGASGTENHYATVQEATKAYEALMAEETVPAASRKPSPAKAPSEPKKKTLEERYPYMKGGFVPDPADSKIIKAPAKNDPHGGYMGGSIFEGGKLEEAKKRFGVYVLSDKQMQQLIREDLKKAMDAGELPRLAYSVRKRSYGGLELIVGRKEGNKLMPLPEDFLERPADPERLGAHAARGEEAALARRGAGTGGVETDEAIQLKKYLDALANQWATRDINGMVDYFSSYGTVRVEWKDKWN